VSPPRFQLALQGGGAGVVYILTALAIVQKYEADQKIEITGLAGTSAGAFAAAVYACGPGSVERAQSYLQANGLVLLQKTTSGRTPKPDLSTLWKAYEGESLFSMNDFRSAVHQVLGAAFGGAEPPSTFKNLPKSRVRIVATDLIYRGARVYERPEESVVEAVLNSAAFPVVFRGTNELKTNPTVDGGFCENLPAAFLQDCEDPILAISFPCPPSAKAPDDLVSYCYELFEAAVHNSVVRARASLPAHATLYLEGSLATFDFKGAFTDSPERKSERTRIELDTISWLDTNIANYEKNSAVPLYQLGSGADPISAELRDWYLAQHSNVECRISKATLVITANSLTPMDPFSGRRPRDCVTRTYCIAPLQPMSCFHIRIGASVTLLMDTHHIEVWAPDGSPVKIRLLPTLDRAKGTRGALILFDQNLLPLADHNKPYKVQYRTETDLHSMDVSVKRNLDLMPSYGMLDEGIGRLEVALYHPKSFELSAAAWLEVAERQTPLAALEGEALRSYEQEKPASFDVVAWGADRFVKGAGLTIDLRSLSDSFYARWSMKS
jgi:predicted acylesterase/phospholipase RssA